MGPYPIELRTRAVGAINSGMLIEDASMIFKVSVATLYRWIEKLKTTGCLKPKEGYQRGHSHKIKDLKAFEAFVKENADKTQTEMGNLLGQEFRTLVLGLGNMRDSGWLHFYPKILINSSISLVKTRGL